MRAAVEAIAEAFRKNDGVQEKKPKVTSPTVLTSGMMQAGRIVRDFGYTCKTGLLTR
ncbi:MAG TPA: hypothetical protein VMW77_06065 [Methanoregula sp.]|nr:hypothetical protein [Methanoregula sp.]